MIRILAALLLLPAAAASEPRICPGERSALDGCPSILPTPQELRRPQFEVPEVTGRRAPEPSVPGADDRIVELEPLRRMRPRGDSVLPSPRVEPIGRDPRAVQRFQAPYRFD